jgi:AraC-like DNA-binding protein
MDIHTENERNPEYRHEHRLLIRAMLGSTKIATDIPEVAEEILSEHYVDLRLELDEEEARRFRLRLDRFDVGPFQLDEMEIGAHASFGFETEDVFFVGRVTRGSLVVTVPGVEEAFDPGEVALLGRPGVAATTEVRDFRQFVTTLHASSIREAAGIEPDGPLPVFSSLRTISPNRARSWRRARDFVHGLFAGDPQVTTAPLVVGSANRMLAGMMLATFANSAIETPTRGDLHDARAPGAVRRAVAFIESRADQDIDIGDIAAAAGVSRRAVQLAFRRHLDTTPTAYLRKVRLDLAHAELLASFPEDGLTITQVAYRWGFSSPSRFAERYRAEFGHPPSEMLRR